MSNGSSATVNRMASFINSVRNRRSVSPVAQRLLELCVHYQQQEQNNQNNLTSSTHSEDLSDINRQAKRRIKSLLKQVTKSKRNGSVDELERAILHKDSRTKCITIPKTPNMTNEQLARNNPVVEYCRLWRWPDLINPNELKPVDFCPNAFHYSLDTICVNPFHYERVPSVYSVYVPRLPPEAQQSLPNPHTSSLQEPISSQIPQNATYDVSFLQQSSSASSPSVSPSSVNSQDSSQSPASAVNQDNNNEPATPMELDIISTVSSNPPDGQNCPYEQVILEEPREWCRISYYEMSMRVGEQYRATQSQVIIDGFTHPSDAERFCLGGLTNIERTVDIDKARRFIGRGVRLFHIRGNVFAECLSVNPVFVQSPIANRRFNWHPATVCKIPPNVRLQIFDSDEFTQILSSAVNEGYKSVYNLKNMCIIRMSLVKGWGVEYGRPSVTCTPCWIEIHLDGPLKCLDNVLSTMRGPIDSITSVS